MPKTRETMIAHLQGREILLEIVGFPHQQAEWIERDLLPRRIYSGHAKGMPWIPT